MEKEMLAIARIKTTWFNTSEKPMSDPFTMG